MNRKARAQALGSSFLSSDTELLIVTNNHVIQGSDTLTVTFNDGTSLVSKISKDRDSEYDVAVIAVPLDSISDETMNSISVATLGDSTTLKVGEPAIAIGNALGYGQSVTDRRDQCFEPFGPQKQTVRQERQRKTVMQS